MGRQNKQLGTLNKNLAQECKAIYYLDLINNKGLNMAFEDFWNLYPRKVARKMAEKAWCRLNTADQQAALDALPNHIRYWEQAGTAKEYIMHATTYLNQARWEDEIEMPQPKQQQATLAWWTTDALIMAKGTELGLTPRPGETMGMFKSRISDKIRAAA